MAEEIGYKTTRTYHFDVMIGGKNYSSQLTRLRMVTSLSTSYQVFYLDFKIDPFDSLLDGGFLGQNSIKIDAFFITEDEMQQEYIPFELMVVGGLNTNIRNRQEMASIEDKRGSQPENINFKVVAVERDAFKKMTTIVNVATDAGYTVEEILSKLCQAIDLELDPLDQSTVNTTKIPQFVIPPTTMTKAIEYLDESFGIYSGPTFSFCFTEDPESKSSTLYVINLAKALKETEVMTLYQQAIDSSYNKKLESKTLDGNNFMIYGEIKSTYSGNTKLSILSKNMNYIIKPKDSLYKIIERDLIEMCSEVGVIYQNDEIQFDSNLDSRTRYFIEHPGNDDDETFIDSFVGKQISNMSMIEVNLSRNLKMDHSFEIGSSVKLDTKTAEYQGLGGRYVMFSSDLHFIRSGKEWSSTGKLYLVRTNKFSGQ